MDDKNMQLSGLFTVTMQDQVGYTRSEHFKSSVMFTEKDDFNIVKRKIWRTVLYSALEYCEEYDLRLISICIQ